MHETLSLRHTMTPDLASASGAASSHLRRHSKPSITRKPHGWPQCLLSSADDAAQDPVSATNSLRAGHQVKSYWATGGRKKLTGSPLRLAQRRISQEHGPLTAVSWDLQGCTIWSAVSRC